MKSEALSAVTERRPSVSRPNFLIVGAMKSGTTTLYADLSAAPTIFIPEQKEPEILYRARSPAQALALYQKYFRDAKEGQVLGEATTTYTMLPEFPSIASFAADALGRDIKIFYVFRDPLKRALSHVFHDLTVGRIAHDEVCTALLDHPRYLNVSDYTRQILPWIEEFGSTNVHLISFETYVAQRLRTVNCVLSFLGCAPIAELDTATVRNEKGSLGRPRFRFLDSAINSNFVQLVVRGLLPKGVTKAAKAVLIDRSSAPKIKFDPQVLDEFQGRLSALPDLRQSFPELLVSVNENESQNAHPSH